MINTSGLNETPHPSPDEVKGYLIDWLDVSPDVRIVEPQGLLTVVGAALTEGDSVIAFNDANVLRTIDMQYAELQNDAALPLHLQSKEAFTNRYRDLIGLTSEELFTCETLTTIIRNRKRPPSEIQQQFEYSIAHLTTAMLHAAIRKQPEWLETICLDTTVGLARTSGGSFLETGDGLRQVLPRTHTNVIQGAPTMKDAVARCSEVGRGGWEHVAMLGSTYYNEELVRSVAHVIFDLSPQKRIYSSSEGLPAGCEALAEEAKGNKRLKSGFGAMILSDTRHLPIEDIIAAIDAAPRLLRPGGLLLISELSSFDEKEGLVDGLIDRAQAVFGREPVRQGLLTTDDDREGRQAIFVR